MADGLFAGLKVIDCASFIAAPGIGQHTDDILCEYGYSNTEIKSLREAKAVA